jgi:acetaldehyde dehydrogenase
MTPSKIGRMCVPFIGDGTMNAKNVNMITCGGQVSIPLIKYISTKCILTYVEVVSQISSESAGMATRINIDKYIETTENAIKTLVNVPQCKVILNINPCKTTIMQTTLFIKATKGDFSDFSEFIKKIKLYIPNYDVIYPTITNDILMTSVKIVGSGDYLSVYAGNLDVINCAAIEVAKKMSTKKDSCSTNIYNTILDI